MILGPSLLGARGEDSVDHDAEDVYPRRNEKHLLPAQPPKPSATLALAQLPRHADCGRTERRGGHGRKAAHHWSCSCARPSTVVWFAVAIMSVICGAAKPGIVATVFVMPISTPAYLPAAQNTSSATIKQMPREEETGGSDLGAMSRWLTLKPERLKPLAPTAMHRHTTALAQQPQSHDLCTR